MSIIDVIDERQMIKYKKKHWSYNSYANGLIRIWAQLEDKIAIKGNFGFFCFECDRGF